MVPGGGGGGGGAGGSAYSHLFFKRSVAMAKVPVHSLCTRICYAYNPGCHIQQTGRILWEPGLVYYMEGLQMLLLIYICTFSGAYKGKCK